MRRRVRDKKVERRGERGIIQYNEIEWEEREREKERTSLVGLRVLFKDIRSLSLLFSCDTSQSKRE